MYELRFQIYGLLHRLSSSARRRKSYLVNRNWRAIAALLTGVVAASAQTSHSPAPDNNAPSVFRFAILPDRTGGNRPGPFEEAIAKLNLLQPEFVMSIGDLIDGYTTDPKVWTAQWDEFDRAIARLGMRFHYVPGNHDISNPQLLEAWRQRHGTPWSSFIYKDVLFLSLHTEDRPGGGLGAEQLTWVKDTLAKNTQVRWTLLFFHRPLWREKNQAGFEEVRAALQDRPYTVFAGHNHSYLKSEADGRQYYVLATAGGSSEMRGVEFGEFDHVTWVTMKPDGPVVANLALSGILPDDIVTEKTQPAVDALRNGSWLAAQPVVSPTEDVSRLSLSVELRNPTALPLHVSGALSAVVGVTFAPEQVEQTVAPDETVRLPLELVAEDAPFSLDALNEAGLSLTLNGAYEINGQRLELPATQRLRLDWQHRAPRAEQPITVDGDLSEWPAAAFTEVERPMLIREDWDWHGPADGKFLFAVQQRDGRVFVAVETVDDRVLTDADPAALQDKVMFILRTSAGTVEKTIVAGTRTADACGRATPTGLVAEIALPLPVGDRSFHLNIGWMDHDRPENTKPSVLWWRDQSPEFGEFVIEGR